MDTVIFETIGGIQYVTGFGVQWTDAVGTKKALQDALTSNAEYQALDKQRLVVLNSTRRLALIESKQKKIPFETRYQQLIGTNLSPILEQMKLLEEAIKPSCLKFHSISSSERVLTSAQSIEYKAKFSSLSSGQVMRSDTGEIIQDNRGEYWINEGTWSKIELPFPHSVIPDGYIKDSELSPEQRIEIEDQRRLSLPEEERLNQYRSELQLLGESLAKQFAAELWTSDVATESVRGNIKQQFSDAKDALKNKYGVSDDGA